MGVQLVGSERGLELDPWGSADALPPTPGRSWLLVIPSASTMPVLTLVLSRTGANLKQQSPAGLV